MKYIYCGIFIFVVLFLTSCGDSSSQPAPPTAENGVLDAGNWDFGKQGPLHLKGEWKFKWMDGSAEYALPGFDDSRWTLFSVPNFWNHVTEEKYGHAWFRLTITHLPRDGKLGLYLLRANTAYELYCNGRLILRNGVAGQNPEEYKPQEFPLLEELDTTGRVTLAWHISNFHNTIGGPGYTPKIGYYNDLDKELLITNFFNFAVFGIILMMGVYHFILWLFFRIDKASFFFSLFCVAIAFRIFLIYKYIQRVFSSHYIYEIVTKIETLTIMFGLIVFLLFFKYLFTHEFSNLLFKIFLAVCAVLSLLVIILPTQIIWDIIIIYYITLVLAGVWLIYMTVMAVKNRRTGGIGFFISMIILFITISFDMIATYLPDMDTNYIYIGMMTILFSQSIILSKRFVKAYKTADHLSRNLQKEVAGQTEIIRKQNEEKTTYFINFAHETKTPLTLILNYLKKYIHKRGEDADLNIIRNNIEKLKINMINFLDYEKLEKGQTFYNHEEITDLSGEVKNAISLFKETAALKQITIRSHIKPELAVRADPHAVSRVINNLIDNAIKYTQKQGNITVTLTPRSDRIELAVTDTGIGIEKEQLANIFKTYYQISHKKQNIQGIGMGLSIVKKILDDINADIRVSSRPGHGSVFCVHFKKLPEQFIKKQRQAAGTTEYPVQSEAGEKPAPAVKDVRKKKILIVEDNADMLAYLSAALGNEYNVYCARNGEQALAELAYIKNVSLVVSDIMMDVMDGYELYDNLVKNEKYSHIPVIFLTARNTQYEKIQALQKGVIDFISKPFDIDELKVKINSIIKLGESQFEKSKYEIIKQLVEFSGKNINKKAAAAEFDNKCGQYGISLREQEIIRMLLKGRQYTEISSKLGVSTNTVKTHIGNIYKKLGVKSKIELIKMFRIT